MSASRTVAPRNDGIPVENGWVGDSRSPGAVPPCGTGISVTSLIG